jgi:uncharacterized protein YdaU (DUF1376 family)
MTTRPWMPLYVADYRGDTTHLTTEQHGAYLLLLMAMWNAGGSLPNDDKTLARICNADPRRWRLSLRAVVLAFFDVVGKTIVQRRLKAEIAKLDELSEKRAEAGRQGGRPKKANGLEPDKKTTTKGGESLSLFSADLRHDNDAKSLENNDGDKAKGADSRAGAFTTPTPTVSPDGETTLRPNGRAAEAPINEALAAYDEMAERCNLGRVKILTPERRKKLKAILDHYGLGKWNEALARIEESDFCRGLVDGRGWKADFDFAVRPSSFAKLLEGKYDNKVESTRGFGQPTGPPSDDDYSDENMRKIGARIEAKRAAARKTSDEH